MLTTCFSVTYHSGAAVRNVQTCLRDGEVLALVGESGSGKSTIVNALLGLLPPTARVEGDAILHGTNLLSADARLRREILRTCIGYVPQDAASCFSPYVRLRTQLWRFWTVRSGTRDRAAFEERAACCVASVLLDPSVLDRYPQQLSIGQMQRVAIANALLTRPRLILADEPTSALDVITAAEILATLDRERAKGVAILLVTHDLAAAFRLAHRAAVLLRGSIVETGSMRELWSRPAHAYTRALMAAASVSPTVGDVDAGCPGPGRNLRVVVG